MTLQDMLNEIHRFLKQACFTDAVDETGVSASTISVWRDEPPEDPSLLVFCRLARYAGLNPTLKQMENLL